MLNKLLNNKLKIFIILLLVLSLASIRAFEAILFYDPFDVYFKGDYLNLPFPDFRGFQLFSGMCLRYFLNTIFSLGIIYTLFKDNDFIKFATVLYVFFFILLIISLFFILYFSDHSNNFLLFYIRRFLIQPLFLLLFIPAFLLQKLK